jgi:hypothetical protein
MQDQHTVIVDTVKHPAWRLNQMAIAVVGKLRHDGAYQGMCVQPLDMVEHPLDKVGGRTRVLERDVIRNGIQVG